MRNIKLIIEYDGTNFFGWQYQPDKRTVQGELEDNLKKIIQEDVKLIGAGRTDQGVHALGQVANFKTNSKLEPKKLQKAINANIPDDIYIRDVMDVDLSFHARFSAKSKVYNYYISFTPSPLRRYYLWVVDYKLEISRMQKAISYFIGRHNFSNFAIQNEKENRFCTVLNLNLTHCNDGIIISVEADRFLHRMVRGMVGFLVDVGRGRFSPEDVLRIFAGELKGLFFAPAHGLCLMEVRY